MSMTTPIDLGDLGDLPGRPLNWHDPNADLYMRWRRFLADFEYRKPNVVISVDSPAPDELPDYLVLDIKMKDVVDTYTGRLIDVRHRSQVPYDFVDENWACQVVRRAIHRAECHEADENIRYRGEMVFDPHRSDPR